MEAIIIPKEAYERLIFKQDQILDKINGLNNESTSKEWLTTKEFMNVIGVKRTKFEELKSFLRLKKIGRKLYIHSTDINRYFNGELK